MTKGQLKINKALIIDDDEISTFLIEYMLKQLEVAREIITISNGKEAVDLYVSSDTGYPDFVILDISMPIMSGYEFLDWYEKNGFIGKSKFVILTSSDRKTDVEKAKDYNDIIGYISKPLTKKKIEKFILEVVGE